MRLMVLGMAASLAFTLQPAHAQLEPSKAPCPAYTSPDIQTHIQAAYKAAGKDLPAEAIPGLFLVPRATGLCAPAMVPPGPKIDATPVDATKAFDQLYYFGSHFVGAWALTTPAGIILVDTMNSTDDVLKIIEPGFRKFGLKMEDIKYVVITHGHLDHWGGAKYIQEKYHPSIYMGPADWLLTLMPPPAGRNLPAPPARDKDIVDGMKLTLGGTTVTLALAPGHTPGSMAAVFPVTDNGVAHVLSLMGGMGIPPHLDPDAGTPRRDDGLEIYLQSVQKVKSNGIAAGADGAISTHPILDGGLAHIEAMKTRKPGDPNPWILGKDGYGRFMDMVYEVGKTVEAELKDPARARATN